MLALVITCITSFEMLLQFIFDYIMLLSLLFPPHIHVSVCNNYMYGEQIYMYVSQTLHCYIGNMIIIETAQTEAKYYYLQLAL